METYGLEEQIMKKVFGVLAFLSFFYLLGVVGAVEQDAMALGAGMVRMGTHGPQQPRGRTPEGTLARSLAFTSFQRLF